MDMHSTDIEIAAAPTPMPGIAGDSPAASLRRARGGYRKRIALLATIVIAAVASATFTLFAAIQSMKLVIASPDASIVVQALAALAALAATIGAASIAVSELKAARADKSRWFKRGGGGMISC